MYECHNEKITDWSNTNDALISAKRQKKLSLVLGK